LEKAYDPKLTEVIDRYRNELKREIGKTKAQVLKTIQTMDIANLRCSEIKSTHIATFVYSLAGLPQTRSNYLSHLTPVFAVAKPLWGYPLDPAELAKARVALTALGQISKGNQRDRRPTLDEMDRLMTHFQISRERRPKSAPMTKIIAFAIFSTRRQEEITLLRWDDLDEPGSRITVRNMKYPKRQNNHVICELTPEALQIIKSMPRVSEFIFPFATDAISAAFTRACQFLQILDLHFHDLRHEGISRLAEMSRTIPQLAAVSGHRSWSSLQRYTHVRQIGDKYAGWKWLPIVTIAK
jgi:integrase